MVAVVAVGICTSGFATTSNLQSTSTTVTEPELGMPDIGDNGTWATENNKNLILNNIRQDVEKFSGTKPNQSTEPYKCDNTYVPLEAKVGLAFMNAFSHVAKILDNSLVRFTILFIVIMYGLWILFEAYTLIIGQNTVKEKVFEMAKVGAKVAIWVVVLSVGPAKMFLWVTSIIMEIGTMFANVVLEATTEIAGLNSETLCNTCDAIKEYAVKNMAATLTGMLCDGAKPSCALKVASGVSTAVMCAMLAMENKSVTAVEGIIDDSVDQSIRNMTKIGKDGMMTTDRLVLDIMTNK